MIQRPKGTNDLLPVDNAVWHFIEETARIILSDYQFKELRTPMFESYELFTRGVGETTDIVTKEMYDFEDKGGRHIALRPEGTASVVRAYVENKLYGPEHPQPLKVYYMEKLRMNMTLPYIGSLWMNITRILLAILMKKYARS